MSETEEEIENLSELDKFRIMEDNKEYMEEKFRDYSKADCYFKHLDAMTIRDTLSELINNPNSYPSYNKFGYMYPEFRNISELFLNILLDEDYDINENFQPPTDKEYYDILDRCVTFLMNDTSKYFLTEWDKKYYKKHPEYFP